MEIIQALSIGGDAAVIAFAILLWRMDRRLLKLEIKIWDREQ